MWIACDVARGADNGRVRRSGITSFPPVFQCPGLDSSFELLHVSNAGILLAAFASFDEVRNRDRGQQADDGNDDHDFNQCEARLTGRSNFHFNLSYLRCERELRAVNIILHNVHLLPFTDRRSLLSSRGASVVFQSRSDRFGELINSHWLPFFMLSSLLTARTISFGVRSSSLCLGNIHRRLCDGQLSGNLWTS
jgi:hypothetical protein